MKYIYKHCCFIFATIVLITTIPVYAGQKRSLIDLKMECPASYDVPTRFTLTVDFQTRLTIIFLGILWEGDKEKLITKAVKKSNDEELENMLAKDNKKLPDIGSISAVVTCGNISKEINPEETIVCGKGENLVVDLYEPTCLEKKDKLGLFTIIVDKDVDDDESKLKQNLTENSFEYDEFSDPDIRTALIIKRKKKCVIQ